jgi:ribosomal protein S18 acetylase RimI-like enzyme
LQREAKFTHSIGGATPAQFPRNLGRHQRMKIEPLPTTMISAAVALWKLAGLTRPWNDPFDDLQRAMEGPASTVFAGIDDGVLVATAIVGDDGHRGWVYYLAVSPDARGCGHARRMMRACEVWLMARDVPKLNLMIRADNADAVGFYSTLGYGNDDVVVMSRRFQ